MRIGIDASPLAAATGGVRRYTQSLIQALSRVDDRNEYLLLCTRERHRSIELAERFCWDRRHFPFKRWVDPFALVGASRRIDVFHGTNYSIPILGRPPSVLGIHDLSVERFPADHPRERSLLHRLLPSMCRRAERIITVSASSGREIVQRFAVPEAKIDVIHHAADERFFPVDDPAETLRVRSKYGLPGRYILTLGAIEPRKNVGALIGALAELRRDGEDASLVIAGPGEPDFIGSLESEAHGRGLLPGRDVFFPGYIEEADLPALYSASELFVFPSLYEGFGLPPLEAMACGVPALVADNSALREIFEDCATLVDISRPEALVRAIRQGLQPGERRAEQVFRGLARAAARTWDDVARETLRSYEGAVSRC